MPKVSDFKNENPKAHSKRRPGRDKTESEIISNEGQVSMSENHSDIKVVDVEKKADSASQQEAPKVEENKVHINFPGSDAVRSKLPKTFEVAEAIATDWMNDGKFDKVPVSHPLAKVAVQQSLRKAKDIEKKVLESPVTEKVAMQAFTYAMKVQNLVNKIRAKVKRK